VAHQIPHQHLAILESNMHIMNCNLTPLAAKTSRVFHNPVHIVSLCEIL